MQNARVAGWAVIQDTTEHAENRSHILKDQCPNENSIPQLQCVATGVVTNKQSAANCRQLHLHANA